MRAPYGGALASRRVERRKCNMTRRFGIGYKHIILVILHMHFAFLLSYCCPSHAHIRHLNNHEHFTHNITRISSLVTIEHIPVLYPCNICNHSDEFCRTRSRDLDLSRVDGRSYVELEKSTGIHNFLTETTSILLTSNIATTTENKHKAILFSPLPGDKQRL